MICKENDTLFKPLTLALVWFFSPLCIGCGPWIQHSGCARPYWPGPCSSTWSLWQWHTRRGPWRQIWCRWAATDQWGRRYPRRAISPLLMRICWWAWGAWWWGGTFYQEPAQMGSKSWKKTLIINYSQIYYHWAENDCVCYLIHDATTSSVVGM